MATKRCNYSCRARYTTVQIPLDARQKHTILMEYKFVIHRSEGWMDWEDGPNRVLPLTLRADGTLESPRMAIFGENRQDCQTLRPVMTMSTCFLPLISREGRNKDNWRPLHFGGLIKKADFV